MGGGVPERAAAYGTEGFTEDHLETFRRQGVGRVLIAYDRDPAGDRAAVLLAVRLTAASLDCFRVPLPQGQDPNEFLLEAPRSAQERFAKVLRKAVWLGQGKQPAEAPAVTVSANPVVIVEDAPAPTREDVSDEVDVDDVNVVVPVEPGLPLSAAEPELRPAAG